MTEWTIVTVLAAIVGLFLAIGAPVIKLNSNVTRLNANLENLERRQTESENDNTKAHQRIWDDLCKKGDTLTNHEMRIHDLEGRDNDGK